MRWYLEVLKKYVVFDGRARRKEYWMFVLFNVIFALIAMGLDNLLGITFNNIPYGYIYMLYILAVVLPGLAAGVRRLHDVGKSGWWLFISLIPFVGQIWLLVLLATEGQSGQNQYGLDPKATV